MIDLLSVLGKSLTSSEVQAVFGKYGPPDFQGPLEEGMSNSHYSFNSYGFSFAFEDDRLSSVHIRLVEMEEHKPFKETIRGLVLPRNKEDVRESLGAPTATGGGGIGLFRIPIPFWDRYDGPEHSVHFTYGETGEVQLVTLMTPDAVPR